VSPFKTSYSSSLFSNCTAFVRNSNAPAISSGSISPFKRSQFSSRINSAKKGESVSKTPNKKTLAFSRNQSSLKKPKNTGSVSAIVLKEVSKMEEDEDEKVSLSSDEDNYFDYSYGAQSIPAL
jgi:hypothetical protein